jgi:hypothetical protein
MTRNTGAGSSGASLSDPGGGIGKTTSRSRRAVPPRSNSMAPFRPVSEDERDGDKDGRRLVRPADESPLGDGDSRRPWSDRPVSTAGLHWSFCPADVVRGPPGPSLWDGSDDRRPTTIRVAVSELGSDLRPRARPRAVPRAPGQALSARTSQRDGRDDGHPRSNVPVLAGREYRWQIVPVTADAGDLTPTFLTLMSTSMQIPSTTQAAPGRT